MWHRVGQNQIVTGDQNGTQYAVEARV